MIHQSLDYADYRVKLLCQIKVLPYNRELRKMLENLDSMVTTLSKAEVLARRNHKQISDLQELKQVNDAIEQLEKWLVMGSLLI